MRKMYQLEKHFCIFLTLNLLPRCNSVLFLETDDSRSEEFADVHKYANDDVTRDEISEGIKFSLFNRQLNKHNEEWKRMLTDQSGRVPLGIWDFNADVKLLIHGITALPVIGLEGQYYMEMAREYSKLNSSLNIILLDWSCCSDGPDYPAIVKNTRRVGFKLAEFLVALKKANAFKNWDQLHLIGFSLGAHTAGVAGYFVQEFSKGRDKIGRITGLDPAGPLFDREGGLMPTKLNGFLDKGDAKFVDIIHCNMGITTHWITAPIEGFLGSVVQAAHADFYPNGGGRQQIYCTRSNDYWGCSHLACNRYYIHSIRFPQEACSCESWEKFKAGGCPCKKDQKVYMGHHCVPTASGKYYQSIELDIGEIDVTKGFFKP